MTSEHISETVSEPFNCSHCDKILLENPTAIAHSPPSSPPFNGFEPAQMKPVLNLSQLDEELEDINELDKCFYEPASVIVTPGKRKWI